MRTRHSIAWSACAAAITTLLVPTSRAFSFKAKMSNNNKTTRRPKKVSVLKPIQTLLENTWIQQLSPETPENVAKSFEAEGIPEFSNAQTLQQKRPVFNGHYVLVNPTPLNEPQLVLYSPQVAFDLLRFSSAEIESDEFVAWVSGNLPAMGPSWATPYALSIMGTSYTHNCPYGTGVGYGDGRAMSLGEFRGYELQLKGSGKTPFCRGADGRAVLRSSLREFLASEAMHYLGVATTRALSLIVSKVDTVQRPWYSDDAVLQLPTVDDPRLANYSESEKIQILKQLRTQKSDPNVLQTEPCAITCRVSSSFTRIGHVDLFARRVEKQFLQNNQYDISSREFQELQQIIWHACFREFRNEAYEPYIADKDIVQAATVLLQLSAEKLSTMVAEWIRVGFAQGNFNADNCLIGGHTMDYGPFGFMEEYSPLFAKWTGSGQHFGFMNQPSAGYANYQVLVESVAPVICAFTEKNKQEVVDEFMTKAKDLFQDKLDAVFQRKMGFEPQHEANHDDLWLQVEPLLRNTRVDWTLFWRQLAEVAQVHKDETETDYNEMLQTLMGNQNDKVNPFYQDLSQKDKEHYMKWLKAWHAALVEDNSWTTAGTRMRLVNPKYVLREWMLVDAYTQANQGNYKVLEDMFELIQHPYDEGTETQQDLYYTRAHDDALLTGGTAFMS